LYNYGMWSRPGRSDGVRSQAAVRRRQVMTALLVCLAVPLLLAVVTGSSGAWWAVVVMLPLVSAYTAVLYRARRLLAEKEMNAAFQGSASRPEATLEELFGPVFEDPFAADAADGAYAADEEPMSAVGGDW
jgi:hypothetical protein